MAGGSGFGSFRKGPGVQAVSEVQPGDLLLKYSMQFDAENVVRVIGVGNGITEEIFYGCFVDPRDTDKPREGAGGQFAVWNFDLGTTCQCWRAVEERPRAQ